MHEWSHGVKVRSTVQRTFTGRHWLRKLAVFEVAQVVNATSGD